MKRVLRFVAMRGARWTVICAALALAAPSVILLPPLSSPRSEARASVSIAATLDALVRSSTAVVLGTTVNQRSVWEGGRIYTYSEVHVETALMGELAEGSLVWVRTMGGVVGNVGQVVDGEAVFTMGRPSLVFLRGGSSSHFVVAARAQGQFGLYTDEASQVRCRRSGAVGGLVPPEGSNPTARLAADVIDGRTVAEATLVIAAAWSRAHAP